MRPNVPRLVLGSSSSARREMLARFGLPFEVCAPAINETLWAAETPQASALRLALAKARRCAAMRPECIVIGGDQVAEIEGVIYSKPGGLQAARVQLQNASGRVMFLHTAIAVIAPQPQVEHSECVTVEAQFRPLSATQIDAYLKRDQPYECAGSFKAEALGIALFERIRADDPTAIVGLPMIALTRLLAAAGIDVLDNPDAPKPGKAS